MIPLYGLNEMGETYSTEPKPVSNFDPISYEVCPKVSGLGSGFGMDFFRIDGDGTGFNGIDGGGTEEINFGFVSICLFSVLC